MGHVNIGVIGVGYWGPNLVRNFNNTPGARVAAVCDIDPNKLRSIHVNYPSIKLFENFSELLQCTDIDAVAIATPVHTHYALTKQALNANKHVLIEKPITSSSNEAQELVELSIKKNLVLLVDHTFVYMGAVRKLHTLVRSGELGDINYYDSLRVNLGLFQNDVNAIWDLAVHDIAILHYLFENSPIAVSSTGMSHVLGQPENVAYITLFYNTNMITHINVNWLSPVKIRQTLISGSKKMVFFDDLHPSEKIKIYDSGVSVKTKEDMYKTLIEYRMGDILIPTYDRKEALAVEAEHFVRCILFGEKPLTHGEFGLHVVKIIEAANFSLRNMGRHTEIRI